MNHCASPQTIQCLPICGAVLAQVFLEPLVQLRAAQMSGLQTRVIRSMARPQQKWGAGDACCPIHLQ